MHDQSDPTLSELRQVASDLRRERADLEARLARLSKLCAETTTLIARSRQSIEHITAVLDASPSIVPEPHSDSELVADPVN